ncbi:hypothetical protein [Cardiobacterium hominis]|uniref:hypothetical protein n=1 Tax=Cardiobacterium hominis TaxID=2718 RepID=UPI00288AE69D|nr:hypothetical protein [Cardiobacterium hominis]
MMQSPVKSPRFFIAQRQQNFAKKTAENPAKNGPKKDAGRIKSNVITTLAKTA